MYKKIVIVIIIIIIIIGIIYLLRKTKKTDVKNNNYNNEYSKELNELINKKIQKDKLKEITYSDSGNMLGNIYEISLDIDSKILKLREREEHSNPVKVKEYVISDEDITMLIDYINKYNLPAWKYLPDSEEYILDGSIPRLYLEYNNEAIGGKKLEGYGIDYGSIMPDDARKILNDFTKSFQNLLNKYEINKEYIEEDE